MMKPILYLIITSLTLSSCISNPNCISDSGSNFEFDLPYTLSPVKDTFSVGDTMWIDHEFSNPIYNIEDGKSYTLGSDFKFKNYMALQDLKTDPIMPTGGFTLVYEDGSVDTKANSFSTPVIYDYENNQFIWKRGLVWQKAGWFVFFISTDISSGGDLRRNGESITKCPTEYLLLHFIRTNGGKNFYLLQEAAAEKYRNITEEQMGSWIAFYVKE